MSSAVVPSRDRSVAVRRRPQVLLAVVAALAVSVPAGARAQCPASSPFMCPEGSCVRGPGDCAAVEGCPSGAPHRCPGGTCAPTPAACGTDRALDPTTYWYGPPVDPAAEQAAADQAAAEQAAADQAAAEEAAAEEAAAAEAMSRMPVASDLAAGLVCPDATPIGCDDDTCCPEDHPWCCGNGLCGADDACAVYVGGIPARTQTTFIAPAAETDPREAALRDVLSALGSDDAAIMSSEEARASFVEEDAIAPVAATVPGDEDGDDEGLEGELGVFGGAPVAPRGPGDGSAMSVAAASADDVELAADEEAEAASGCAGITPTAARASTAFGVAALALILAATLVRMRQNRLGRRRLVTAR